MSEASPKGNIAVISAIIGNFIITILKFFAAIFTGSGVMLSEAIHSTADTANQLLLLIGIQKSRKKADNKHSYGYGKERYFWALLSACGIFFIGAGTTIYHGITSLTSHHKSEHILISIIVLLIAFFVEGLTLIIALKSVYSKEKGFIKSVKTADNASLAVIFEDSIAVIGVIIALSSIILTQITHITYFDGIGSIIIGFLLALIAIILIIENKSFLLGKSIDEQTKYELIELIESQPLITKVYDFRSEVIDLNTYMIKCDAEFNGSHLIKEINRNSYLHDEYEYIKEDYNTFLKFCVDYADRIPRIIGKNIDELEKIIREKYPNIKHIDIELN